MCGSPSPWRHISEPEILVVDEVLAVGDAEFQKKCLGKMSEVAVGGRTVILVSHNLAAIKEMSDRAILLEAGNLSVDGTAERAIASYLSKDARKSVFERTAKSSSGKPYVSKVEVNTSSVNGVHEFGQPLELKFWISHKTPIQGACFSFQIINGYQVPVLHDFAYYPDIRFGEKAGASLLVCRFPNLRLNVGEYHVQAKLAGPPGTELYDTVQGVCHFEVIRTDQNVLWGWHADACVYHETSNWIALDQ